MSILSVRLPKELARALPSRDRSAWVLDAIRERLRRERIEEIARSAANNAHEELEALNDWAPATAAITRPLKRRARKGLR